MARKDKAKSRLYQKRERAAADHVKSQEQDRTTLIQRLLAGSALSFDHAATGADAATSIAILTSILQTGNTRNANLVGDLYENCSAGGSVVTSAKETTLNGNLGGPTAAKITTYRGQSALLHHLNLHREGRSGNMVFGPVPDREYHEGFMRKAIEMAEMALRSDETPVGCVFVHKGEIIGRGINGTNATLNGTRHAEFVALAEIMSTHPQSILKETDLYVTVEPCIMCASALRQYGIRTVYFGCLNDRFGGTGGVMTVNQDPGIDPPFHVYGGLFREEAIMLLRRFYVQENEKAPDPKPKKNRELKTAILPVNAPVTRAQPPTAIARALAAARAEAEAEAAEQKTPTVAAGSVNDTADQKSVPIDGHANGGTD